MGDAEEPEPQALAYVNGQRYELPSGKAECTLLQWLREEGLTGTKLGCGEGGCGACTVMVSTYEPEEDKVVHRSANACLTPLYAVESCQVVTVEGIGTEKNLHPIQEKLANVHGSQCGFCTPGFVMSMYSLYRHRVQEGKGAPTMEEIEDNLAGNLCRCTGYRPILEAFRHFSKGNDESFYTRSGGVSGGNGADSGCCGGGGEGCPCKEVSPSEVEENGKSHTKANGKSHTKANGKSHTKANGKCHTKANGKCHTKANGKSHTKANGKSHTKANGNGKSASAPREPIFPFELKRRVRKKFNKSGTLVMKGARSSWYRPGTLQELLNLKKDFGSSAKLVCGNTEVGIEMKFKHCDYQILISPMWIPELVSISFDAEARRVTFGACATLTNVTEFLNSYIKSVSPEQLNGSKKEQASAYETSGFGAIVNQLKWFAGHQIKNMATIAGNVVTGSPISDLNPLWMCCGAKFKVVGEEATKVREVKAEDFFLGYRKVDLKDKEILYQVDLPCTRMYEYVQEFKQAHRREDDISIVCAGMRVKFAHESGRWIVEDIAIAYGGVAAKTIMAPETQKKLIGMEWNRETLVAGLESLKEEIYIAPNAPGGMVEFRRSLVASFFFKFFVNTSLQLSSDSELHMPDHKHKPSVEADEISAAAPYSRPASFGLQLYDHEKGENIIGKAIPHASAKLQVTGEAKYVDDIPLFRNELHSALVLSTKPHALIENIDTGEALAMEGVVGYYGHEDVRGGNNIGPVIPDEECFASEKVTCVGQVIGIIVAETEQQARDAARKVQVTYKDLPAIISIADAIENDSFYDENWESNVERGDVDKCFASGECTHIVEGDMKIGAQDHFYLETNACVVVPLEGDEVLTYSSTQAPAKHQRMIAHVLGIPEHKVVCKAKRLGGGFGGKETRGVFLNCAAAVPAFDLERPVRLCLDRDEDMQMTGHRHAFYGKYKVGFNDEGKILAVDLKLYSNGGNSLDLSAAVMQRAVLHADNCYNYPNARFHGRLCKTNISSNTAFRGFGGPQGMIVTEAWMDHVARELNVDVEQVRQANLYKEGDEIPCGMKLEGNNICRVWEELEKSSDFKNRKQKVEEFNKKNKYRKRGIALVPTKFGIAFTLLYYNQGGALVHIYTDGTVLVTHGGVEMGQGLHTKIAQIAASTLKIPVHDVFISETSTDKVPNASPTAASASSDLYGAAVLDACNQLNERLQKYRDMLPGGSMAEIAMTAHKDRVDLSAHGFYKMPDIGGFGSKRPFLYYTYGAACSEVEVDVLTGDYQIHKTDILMDVGNSINPAIDVGQIEGGFTQGIGLMTIEEAVWGDKEHPWVRPGVLHTRGPGTYKIPTANDIPIELNVSLLQDAPNPHAVASSKAIGEPPLFLGSSVFFAIKNAVYSARAGEGEGNFFPLYSPATPEKIRMACVDKIIKPYAGFDYQPKTSV